MDFQNQLQDTIHGQARKTGVNVGNYYPGVARPDTNGFFEEESIRISFDSQEPQLISFLYNIGGDPAMIRVSELELSPQDQNRYRLQGASFTLIFANYAKDGRHPRQPAAANRRRRFREPNAASGPGSSQSRCLEQNRDSRHPPASAAGPARTAAAGGGLTHAPRTPFLPKIKQTG